MPISVDGDNKKTRRDKRSLLESKHRVAQPEVLRRKETELPEKLKEWRAGPFRICQKWLAPPCGGSWQRSVREVLFDPEQGYLGVLGKVVHTKDGAV